MSGTYSTHALALAAAEHAAQSEGVAFVTYHVWSRDTYSFGVARADRFIALPVATVRPR